MVHEPTLESYQLFESLGKLIVKWFSMPCWKGKLWSSVFLLGPSQSSRSLVSVERNMQRGLHEFQLSGAVSFPFRCPGKGDFVLTPCLLFQKALQRAVRLDKWTKIVTQPFCFCFFSFFPTVHLLKRTLQRCEKNGWLEQISGKGFSGTFQLCFPYYPR